MLEPGLQREDLALLGARHVDQPVGGLLVCPQREATVLDVLPVGIQRGDDIDVAVAETLHQVELQDEVVEAPGSEHGVKEARVARLVDGRGTILKLSLGQLEVVFGESEELLVLLDLHAHRCQVAARLVELLDGGIRLSVDRLELRLRGPEACLLGRGR